MKYLRTWTVTHLRFCPISQISTWTNSCLCVCVQCPTGPSLKIIARPLSLKVSLFSLLPKAKKISQDCKSCQSLSSKRIHLGWDMLRKNQSLVSEGAKLPTPHGPAATTMLKEASELRHLLIHSCGHREGAPQPSHSMVDVTNQPATSRCHQDWVKPIVQVKYYFLQKCWLKSAKICP